MESKGVANPIAFCFAYSIGRILDLTIQNFGPTGSYPLLGVEKDLKMWSKLTKISKSSRSAYVA